MPMHIPSNINVDSRGMATLPPRTGPLSPATQTDILGILQREQDNAMSLLSSSPLLSSLFVSYANRAAALESASAAASPNGEESTVLQATVAALREENKKLRSENVEVAGKLEAATASQEVFRAQVSSLREVNVTQQEDIKSLRSELVEAKEKYDRFAADSIMERAALRGPVLDLEAQLAELKEAVVEQQTKILTLKRRHLNNLSNFPATEKESTEWEAKELTEGGLGTGWGNGNGGGHMHGKRAKMAVRKTGREARESEEAELRKGLSPSSEGLMPDPEKLAPAGLGEPRQTPLSEIFDRILTERGLKQTTY